MINPALNVQRAVWPADPYGYNHGLKCAELVDTIARSLGASEREVIIVRAAALLHDLGRTETRQFWAPEPAHAARGAGLAREVLEKEDNWRADADARREVQRLVGQHQLERPPPAGDLLAVALWDADSLEAARFDTSAASIRDLVRRRYSRLLSPFARQPAVQERYLASRAQAGTQDGGRPVLNAPLSSAQVRAYLQR